MVEYEPPIKTEADEMANQAHRKARLEEGQTTHDQVQEVNAYLDRQIAIHTAVAHLKLTLLRFLRPKPTL